MHQPDPPYGYEYSYDGYRPNVYEMRMIEFIKLCNKLITPEQFNILIKTLIVDAEEYLKFEAWSFDAYFKQRGYNMYDDDTPMGPLPLDALAEVLAKHKIYYRNVCVWNAQMLLSIAMSSINTNNSINTEAVLARKLNKRNIKKGMNNMA